MHDVSASGMKIRLVAVPTFPAGFDITRFSDDSDPVSGDNVDIASAAAALNGDMVSWSVPNLVPVRVNVLPGTEEARNLDILWSVNRSGKNKVSVKDTISMVITYPDGRQKAFGQGVMLSGPPFDGASSEGRLRTREYGFAFQDAI